MERLGIVCVDFDGTVLDFHEGIRRRLAGDGITYYPHKVVDYNFKGDIGCTPEQIFKVMDDPALYGMLPFFENAEKALELLVASGDTVYGYTATVDNPDIEAGRIRLVESLHMTPKVFKGRKPPMEADALFDDCLGVHRTWVNAGTTARLYLIDAPHNQMREENKDDPIWRHVVRFPNLYEAVKDYLKNR